MKTKTLQELKDEMDNSHKAYVITAHLMDHAIEALYISSKDYYKKLTESVNDK